MSEGQIFWHDEDEIDFTWIGAGGDVNGKTGGVDDVFDFLADHSNADFYLVAGEDDRYELSRRERNDLLHGNYDIPDEMNACASCGKLTRTPEEDRWCNFGPVEMPTDDAEIENEYTEEMMGYEIDVVEYTEYKEIPFWECDDCCPVCNGDDNE